MGDSQSKCKGIIQNLHDLDLKKLDGVALMADTDNSGLSSISYYQNIYFSAN